MKCFTDTCASTYGTHFVTLVVHYLEHLPDECRKLGPMDTFSCFKYENTLKSLKKRCRSFKNPLKNLANQLRIKSTFISKTSRAFMTGKPVTTLKRPCTAGSGSGIAGEYYQTVVYRHHILTIKSPDCYFYTCDKKFYRIFEIIKRPQEGILLGCKRYRVESAYCIPTSDDIDFESSSIGVYKLIHLSDHLEYVRLHRFQRKGVVHCLYDSNYAYPML